MWVRRRYCQCQIRTQSMSKLKSQLTRRAVSLYAINKSESYCGKAGASSVPRLFFIQRVYGLTSSVEADWQDISTTVNSPLFQVEV